MDTATKRAAIGSTRCHSCGGECALQLIELTLNCTPARLTVVRNVPADVCQTCGESQFSMLTARRVLAVLQAGRPPDDVAVIPIYDLYPRDDATVGE